MIFRLIAFSLFSSLFCHFTISVANEGLPTDPRSLFNHGAELAASGKFDEATDVLRQTAVVRDKFIAAKALSLLGQIAAASARQLVSENSAETPPEHQQTILEHLQSAEHHFTESLSLLPTDEVRQYLETLRAWRHNRINDWEEHDREQLRNAELQQRIQWLANWEEKLLETIRPITEEPDSPLQFQTGYEMSREQKQLAEELAMLQTLPVNDEELQEKWKHLPEIQKIADDAAELLSKNRMEEALSNQQQVHEYLRSLLKQEQKQDNQEQDDKQDQEQEQEQNQDQDQDQQQNQNQQQQENQDQQSQPNESDDNQDNNGDQEQKMNPPPSTRQEEAAQKEEDAKERAERLLMQVRRKEQAAEKRREQLRTQQLQAVPVEKDW